MAANDYALVVGIARYPQLTPLSGPVGDAREFRKWLISPAGGAVPPKQAKLIVSRDSDVKDPMRAPPMLSDVQSELDRLQQLGLNNDGYAGRRLWIYLAGHGVAPTARDAALLMANANLQRLYHLPAGPYVNWFLTTAMFDEVAVIADCCRDYMGGRLPPFFMPWPDMASPGADVHYFIAFATKWSRKARERAIDGDGEIRGLFTYALLEGLKQGRSTASSLSAFVEQRLPELVGNGEFQEPFFDFDVDLQLAATRPPKPCVLHVDFAAENPAVTVRVLDGAYREIEAFPMTGRGQDVGVDPAVYVVRRSDKPDAEQVLIAVTTGSEHVTV
jgi:hypothetical protein